MNDGNEKVVIFTVSLDIQPLASVASNTRCVLVVTVNVCDLEFAGCTTVPVLSVHE